MAGSMRKMGVYLGLLEDGDYADYEQEPTTTQRRRPAEPARAYEDDVETTGEVARLDDRRRDRAPAPRAVDRAERPAESRIERPSGAPQTSVAPLSRIVTLHPRTYNEARVIGENFRDGVPVIMNLSEMDDDDAKRLVDFAAGLVFATRGSIERVTNKVFLLSPPNVSVAAEDKQRIAEGGFFNQS